MSRIIVFDVNETLLDLSALDPHFKDVFGAESVRQEWFNQVLRLAMTLTITGRYEDFATVAAAALDMVSFRHNLQATHVQKRTILEGVRELPPHPDVVPGLTKLKEAGLRLITLTNSPPKTLEAQLTNAGLKEYFEHTLSVDAVKKLKPAVEVYNHAADFLGVTPSQLRLVAAHEWDISGAMRAGYAGALITRPGVALGPLSESPDIIAPTIESAADKIIAAESVG